MDLKKLREEFFKEHTEKVNGIPKVTTHPHNLFEWFKEKINHIVDANKKVTYQKDPTQP